MSFTHRKKMSQAIGRSLLPTEFVHHINGDRHDNRLENLRIVTPSEHAHLHPRPKTRIRKSSQHYEGMEAIIPCQRCKRPFSVQANEVRRKYCDECRPVVLQESGKRTGGTRSRPRAKSPPVVIDAIVVSRRKRPDMVLDDA